MIKYFIPHICSVLALSFGLAVPQLAHADVIYNATGGAENGGDPLSGAGPILADRFVSTITGVLDSVSLNLLSAGGSGFFTVDLFADTGAGGPGAAIVLATVSDADIANTFTQYTFTPGALVSLLAGQSYYIGISGATSTASLGNTLDAAVLARPDVSAGGFYYNNGGVQANAGGPYEIIVNASAVPEPASLALMLGGMGALFARRKRQTM